MLTLPTELEKILVRADALSIEVAQKMEEVSERSTDLERAKLSS